MTDAPQDQQDKAQWPTAEQAAAQLKVSRRTFTRIAEQAGIKPENITKGRGRSYVYNPADIARLALDQGPAIDLTDAPTAALLAQVYTHNEFLLRRNEERTDVLLEHYKQQVGVLQARCQQLEQTHSDLLAAREEALSEGAMRDLMVATEMGKQERMDKALASAIDLAPKVLNSRSASKLINSFTPEQIQGLLAVGGERLTADQRGALQARLDAMLAARKKSTANGAEKKEEKKNA